MANIREAFEYASKNPNSDFAKNLEKMAASGSLNLEAKKYGLDLSPFQPKPEPAKRSIGEKVLDFTGGKEIAQGLGQGIANTGFAEKGVKIFGKEIIAPGNVSKQIQETQSQQMDIQGQLLARIKENKATGQDTSRLENALAVLNNEIYNTGEGAEKLLNQNELTTKQVLGDALQLGTTVGTIGGLSGAGASKTIAGKTIPGLKIGGVQISPGLTTQAPGIAQTLAGKLTGGGVGTLRGAGQGLIAGAGQGVVTGALTGASQGLQADKTGMEILQDAGKGSLIGGLTGGVLGTLIGGISGRVKSSDMRKAILNNQYSTGEKIAPVGSAVKNKTIQIAKQQGFNDVDIEFVNSMKPQDRIQAQKMIDLAQKASVNKRAIERPIDIVGDSMTKRVKFIQKQNSLSGKAVDTTAKALKGQMVDSMPVREKALSLLEDIGVTANKNGTPNWSKSIFKKTPELEKKIMKALSDLPAGEMDAYDLHNFKKSIDEVVNYGVGGEGLKGKSASILKAIRASADDVLDSNFADYNKANTDYKATRDVLEIANDLFGKKVGISKERGGQLLRSVFSNNANRPRVMALIEQLDNTSKAYGGKFKDNLIDQALFTEILEDIYGTQATTSLQGQVGRAIKGTQRVIEGVRDPIKGAGDLLATSAEKVLGVSEENKKKILSALLR